MKSMKNLINQMSSLPFFEKVDYIKNIKLFKEKLPKTIKKHIVHIYQKKEILFIVVTHPAITMELNNKKNDLMFILNLFQTHKKILTDIKDIKIFHTNKTQTKLQSINNEKNIDKVKKTFTEQSNATFINNLDDITLYNKLEAIRNMISSKLR